MYCAGIIPSQNILRYALLGMKTLKKFDFVNFMQSKIATAIVIYVNVNTGKQIKNNCKNNNLVGYQYK